MRNTDKHKILMRAAAAALAFLLSVGLISCGSGGILPELDIFDNLGDSSEFSSDTEWGTGTPADFVSDKDRNEERETYSLEKQEPQFENETDVTSAGQAYSSVSAVYYAVADSVVEITTETVQNSIWMGQYVSEGAGSGVIIDKSGLIVTNNHVIEGANYVTVRLTDGTEYEASLVGTDAAADLAVIKIDPAEKELCVAPLGCSADLIVGEDVLAIGNPLGSLGGTLTTGIISATERAITIDGEEMVLLQTNAAINPGNSGGGLFNMAGQLIGVVNAKASGEDVEGLGFAIPIDFAHRVIEDLVNYGYVRGVVDHGLIMLDVTGQNLAAAYRKYGITTTGVYILESRYTGELQFGDRLLSINGSEVSGAAQADLICKSFSVGDTVTVAVTRGNQVIEVKLTLQEKVPDSVSFE